MRAATLLGPEELQADLDVRLEHYNTERPNQGRCCYRKTPMQTFLHSVPVAKEERLAKRLARVVRFVDDRVRALRTDEPERALKWSPGESRSAHR